MVYLLECLLRSWKLGVQFPYRVIPKEFNNWYLQLPFLMSSFEGQSG